MSEIVKVELFTKIKYKGEEHNLQELFNYLVEQLEQKENIIKEVREKIKEDNLYLEEAKKMYIEDADDEMLKIHTLQLINNNLSHNDNYLKILDKEVNND